MLDNEYGQKISVAMATFNGAEYLAEQLDSFTAQSILPNELIVSDDSSIDNTVEIVERYSRNAPFSVKILSNRERLGYAANFSRALAEASGDIVFIADQDDVWMLNKIERVLQVFATDETARLVIHDIDFCRADLSKIGQTKIERMSGKFSIMNSYVTGMATAVERSFLSLCLPVPADKGFAHDTWIHKCAMLLGVKAILPESLALYRRHDANATAASGLNTLDAPLTDATQDRNHFFLSRLLQPTEIARNDFQVFEEWLKQLDRQKVEELGVSSSLIESHVTNYSNKSNLLERRRQLLCERRDRRVLEALRLARDGGYKQHNGLLSLLKDLLGP